MPAPGLVYQRIINAYIYWYICCSFMRYNYWDLWKMHWFPLMGFVSAEPFFPGPMQLNQSATFIILPFFSTAYSIRIPFNSKTTFLYWISALGPISISRPSFPGMGHGDPYTVKTTSLYWDSLQVPNSPQWMQCWLQSWQDFYAFFKSLWFSMIWKVFTNLTISFFQMSDEINKMSLNFEC